MPITIVTGSEPRCALVAVQVFTRFDTQTGAFQSWSPGPRCFCEELIFVPGAEGARKEDDGALLGMVFDAQTQTSSLVVSAPLHVLESCHQGHWVGTEHVLRKELDGALLGMRP